MTIPCPSPGCRQSGGREQIPNPPPFLGLPGVSSTATGQDHRTGDLLRTGHSFPQTFSPLAPRFSQIPDFFAARCGAACRDIHPKPAAVWGAMGAKTGHPNPLVMLDTPGHPDRPAWLPRQIHPGILRASGSRTASQKTRSDGGKSPACGAGPLPTVPDPCPRCRTWEEPQDPIHGWDPRPMDPPAPGPAADPHPESDHRQRLYVPRSKNPHFHTVPKLPVLI